MVGDPRVQGVVPQFVHEDIFWWSPRRPRHAQELSIWIGASVMNEHQASGLVAVLLAPCEHDP